MKFVYSEQTGICLFAIGKGTVAVNAGTGVRLDSDQASRVCSFVDDWVEEVASDQNAALEFANRQYQAARCEWTLVQCAAGLSPKTTIAAVNECEKLLLAFGVRDLVIAKMSAAPLRSVAQLEASIQTSMANGCATIAGLLDRILAVQPLLTRLSERWLMIPDSEFQVNRVDRRVLWRTLADRGYVIRFAEANGRAQFQKVVADIVFDRDVPLNKKGLARITNLLEESLFPKTVQQLKQVPVFDDSDDWELHGEERKPVARRASAMLDRVDRQIRAILDAVVSGRDRRANQFLEELISYQLEESDGAQYLVKSLCRLAQRSSEVYRTDFERICLQRAMDLSKHDAWLRVQWGDHLKRTGQFAGAKEILETVVDTEKGRIARCVLADVNALSGNLTEARRIYMSVDGWQSDDTVQMALADLDRRQGNFGSAEGKYRVLLGAGVAVHRARAGLAEIARRRGQYRAAEAIYKDIVESTEITERDRSIYLLHYAGLLKQCGKFVESLEIADRLVGNVPFLMPARNLKASLLGLMNNAERGISSLLDARAPQAFGEWMSEYLRGALLMRTNRFALARKHLLDTAGARCITESDRTFLLCGAAVSWLGQDRPDLAAKILPKTSADADVAVDHLMRVLELHIAMSRGHNWRSRQLLYELEFSPPFDSDLAAAVRHLRQGSQHLAVKHEVSALLKITG